MKHKETLNEAAAKHLEKQWKLIEMLDFKQGAAIRQMITEAFKAGALWEVDQWLHYNKH